MARIAGPEWLLDWSKPGSGYYQFDARFPEDPRIDSAMMRQMLTSRFHLVVLVERPTRVYALRVGPDGLTIKPSAPKDPSQPPGQPNIRGFDTRVGVVRVLGLMTLVALAISYKMDMDVVDETGRDGTFDESQGYPRLNKCAQFSEGVRSRWSIGSICTGTACLSTLSPGCFS